MTILVSTYICTDSSVEAVRLPSIFSLKPVDFMALNQYRKKPCLLLANH